MNKNMVKVAYLFPLVYCIGFFIANFSCDVSAIRTSIADASFSESADEDIPDRPRRALALLVPLDDVESGEEHHKSKRCWKARSLRKMRPSCDPNEIYRRNAESTGRIRYNRKHLVGLNNMEGEQLPHAVPYVKIVNDLYENEKRSAEESEESWNSNESSEDHSTGKIPWLRIAPVKNPKNNLKGLFETEKESQDDATVNEYDGNSEDLILKKIKNHLNSADYNVLALVGKRADHSVAGKSKKYFCYCSDPNCPPNNCQRITYKPCLTRKNLRPNFFSGAKNYHSNNGRTYSTNEEAQTIGERIPVNVQYPVPRNHYNEYLMNKNIQAKNNPRVSPSLGQSLQPDAISEMNYKSSQHNPSAFIDGRSREFYYGSPRGTIHRYNNIGLNENQYRVTQSKPTIGNVYPVIPLQANANDRQSIHSQWAVNSYNPFGRRTGNQLPNYNNQIITQDSFKGRDINTGFVDSTVPLTGRRIVGSFQQQGAPRSETSQMLGTMQPKAADLHPNLNYAYDNKFVGNSHHSGDGFAWNLPIGMRPQHYYPPQHHYQNPFQRLTPSFEHTINHQEAPESPPNLGKYLESLNEPVALDKEKSHNLETDEEMDTQFDFEDERFQLSTESNLGVQASSEINNENRSDESLDDNTEDESYEDFKLGNEHPQITIDHSKSSEATETTVPPIFRENLGHDEYPQNANRVGDSAKVYSSYEGVSDEDQEYRHPSISSETTLHSNSDEFYDTSTDYERMGSRIENEEEDTQHTIQNHNTGYSIDESASRTQIERPTEEKPAWNRYGDEDFSNPIIQPENNYRNDPNIYSMIDYNLMQSSPRLDQDPKFFSHTNENHGLIYHFPTQGILESKGNSESAGIQPKYIGMENSDRVFTGNSDSAGRFVSRENDYSDNGEETNGYFTSRTHNDVEEISDKNIQVKETESTDFSKSIAKSSDDSHARYEPTQHDGIDHTPDYEESFGTSHEIKSSLESDFEENSSAVTTGATQSEYDDSDETSTMLGPEVLDNLDAVSTESGQEITEDETKKMYGTDSASSSELSSDEKIVGENQPIEVQERNGNIQRELESEEPSTNLNSQRMSAKTSSSVEKSSSQVLGEKWMESEHKLGTTEAKDNHESHFVSEKHTPESNEDVFEEYDDEDTDKNNEPLSSADIVREESATTEDKFIKAMPKHVDPDGDKIEEYLGEGSIESYEDENSHSEENQDSIYLKEDHPIVANDEHSEKVGATKIGHTISGDEISSCPVLGERAIPIENSPTKYFSPHDRILEYVKKHSTSFLAPKYSSSTGVNQQRVKPVIYHTQQSESGSQSDEIHMNLSQNEEDWYDHEIGISNNRNDEQETVKTEISHESSVKHNFDKNKQPENGEINHLIHLTENEGKKFRTFEHYKEYDDSASDSEQDASESDETYKKTDNREMKVSSILEHRKNSAEDELTQNYQDASELIADTHMPLGTHKPTQIIENNKEAAIESSPMDVLGGIRNRNRVNFEDEDLQTSTEYPVMLGSTALHEIKYGNIFCGIKDSEKNKESAGVAELAKELIPATHDHNSAESFERSVNTLGNSKGLSTGSNYHEQRITHLQKELAPHDHDYSVSSKDLESSNESGESATDHMTEKSFVSQDRAAAGEAESILGSTPTCGCSLAGRKVTTDGEKNGKRVLVGNFLNPSYDADGVDAVTIKHRENYNSAEESTSMIETQERQSQEVSNRENSEMNTDKSVSPEFDKNINHRSKWDLDQYVGVKNPVIQSTTGSSSSDVRVDQDTELVRYSSESEEKQHSTLSDNYENGGDDDMGENLSTIGERIFSEDGKTKDVEEGKKYRTEQGTENVENFYSVSHDKTRDKLSSSSQVKNNHESNKFSSEVKSAEFIGSPRSLDQGSCTKPPEVQNDIGYLGRLAPKKPNAEVKTLGDLVGSDLYYIGDGVRLPLTIKKLKDGSFALSISDKICEQRIAEKCPCCVPREGRILQEKRGEFDAGESLENVDSEVISTKRKRGTNQEQVEKSQGHQLERNERALDVDNDSKYHKRVARSITMPVDEFIEKYNLNLNLDDVQEQPKNLGELTEIESRLKHNVIKKDEAEIDPDPEEQNSSLVQEFVSINDVPQNVSANVLLTTLKNLIATEPADIHAVINGFKKELSGVKEGEKSNAEKEVYGLENYRYGYQRGNLILDKIAIIKKLQNNKYRCEHRYHKDCDVAITEKTKLLTTILYWLKDLVTEQQN